MHYRMESLRCLPPVPGTPRVAAKDMRIGDVFIPKGTLLPIHVRYGLGSESVILTYSVL